MKTVPPTSKRKYNHKNMCARLILTSYESTNKWRVKCGPMDARLQTWPCQQCFLLNIANSHALNEQFVHKPAPFFQHVSCTFAEPSVRIFLNMSNQFVQWSFENEVIGFGQATSISSGPVPLARWVQPPVVAPRCTRQFISVFGILSVGHIFEPGSIAVLHSAVDGRVAFSGFFSVNLGFYDYSW